MSFEEKMKRLEWIVNALSDESISLEEAMDLYKEGTDLIKNCNQQLTLAEEQFSDITAE